MKLVLLPQHLCVGTSVGPFLETQNEHIPSQDSARTGSYWLYHTVASHGIYVLAWSLTCDANLAISRLLCCPWHVAALGKGLALGFAAG